MPRAKISSSWAKSKDAGWFCNRALDKIDAKREETMDRAENELTTRVGPSMPMCALLREDRNIIDLDASMDVLDAPAPAPA